MEKRTAIEELIKKICVMIDEGQIALQNAEGKESIQIAMARSEVLQKFRDASDEEYRIYINNLLNSLLTPDGDYIASDGYPHYISAGERGAVLERVFSMYRGLGIVDTLLMDDTITELMINGPDHIFVEKGGRVVQLKEKMCMDTDCTEQERIERGSVQLRKIIRRIVDICGRDISDASPIVDARLKDGSRVNIVLHPIALGGDTVTIRKFSKKPMSVEKLIEYKSITQEIADKLKLLVYSKYNIFISGGTGSGKTTFLNALSNYIPRDERVITIEDSAELQITGVDNLVRLETKQANAEGNGGISIKDLIKSSLRMRPERIVVGEVRGEEALDMLQAMNTGHDGSLSTGHANSAKDMLTRIETMVLQGASGLPLDAVRRQIGSALDIIVHLSRMRDHSRKVVEITEVLGYEDGEILLNPIYVFQEDENSTLEKVSGGLVRTENEMKNTEKLRMAGILENL